MKRFVKFIRNRFLLTADILLSVLAYAFVSAMIFPVSTLFERMHDSAISIAMTAVIFVLTFCVFRIYKIYWLYGSMKEFLRLIVACVIALVFGSIADSFLPYETWVYFKYGILAKLALVCFVMALRVSIRIGQKLSYASMRQTGKRVLVIGAGRLGAKLLSDIRDDRHLQYHVVGLIDDSEEKEKRVMYGAEVLGTRYDIPRICKEQNVEEIIFAISEIDRTERQKILEICSKTNCKVKIMPDTESVLSVDVNLNQMRHIEIEDLLERTPVDLDINLIENDIRGKVIMVTGGGGSIGSELCRQIVRFQPKLLIILDIYENTTYELQNELEEKYPNQAIKVFIASIRDKARLENIFERYQPEILFHAAAHKHVPLMEYSPGEAVKNNVFGTYNLALCADKFHLKRFVMISTDKAVNPTNVMGATKRMCEMIIRAMATESETEFVAVRFGNVLGSNGSVIPRFKKQIAAGGPVTVTHPEITRFFMTIPEAASLVLQAGANAANGEIFVLDMGNPVKIHDLAKNMIHLAGFKPNEDIKIVFTGLRPGEKLYEELLMDEEGIKQTAHRKIFIGSPIAITKEEMMRKLEILQNALSRGDSAVKQALMEVVPTYIPKQGQNKETEDSQK